MTKRRLPAVVSISLRGVVATAVCLWCVAGCTEPEPEASCPLAISDFGTIDAFASTRAVRFSDGAGKETVDWLGALQAGPTGDVLDVQLIEGAGAFAGSPPVPGTFELTGDETQLATCGVCLVLELGTPREYFLAQSGTLVVDEVGASGGGHLRASLANVTFAHVMVDLATSTSVPLDDGCHTSITAASWDTPID